VIGKQTTNFFKKKEKKRAYTDEEALTLSRQDQLLRTVYGSDFKRMQNAILPTIRANISRESFEEISQNMMSIGKAVNDNIVDPFKNIDNPKTYDKLNDKTPAQLQIATSISSIIDYTMQEVYKNHADMMSMVVTIDPNHLTVYVPLLASQLDTIR
jgi:hypothetical protein